MLEKDWKTMAQKPVENIHDFLREMKAQGRDFHIATDSQQFDRYTRYVSVICALTHPGIERAAHRVIYCQNKVRPKIKNMYQRLLQEVLDTVTLGMELAEQHDIAVADMVAHIDINQQLKYKSGKFHNEFAGIVKGMGFELASKPDAWWAAHVCDHIVKHKNY